MTKQELEDKVKALQAELEALQAENEALQAELDHIEEAREAREKISARLPKTCINCGQRRTPLQMTEDGRYLCPVCKHVWDEVDERAPFRREV